jgi:hypothetical protein
MNHATITLRNGKILLVDSEDAELLNGHNVYTTTKPGRTVSYAHFWSGGKQVSVHRIVMKAMPGQIICHLNGNGLDCRKANLAVGNARLNGASVKMKRSGSASKYRGVHVYNGRGRGNWSVRFFDDGKGVNLGLFDSEIAAAKAYDQEASKRFGRFAHLNFPALDSLSKP